MLEPLTKGFRRISRQWKKKAIVLCYHRIANQAVDPWNISVSPQHFDEHLRVLAKDYNVVDVNDLIANFDGIANRKTVCISFDDGYTDNYTAARPLLKNYGLPACFFIASSFLGTEQLFWWDELAEIILTAPMLPTSLNLQINRKHFSFELDDCAELSLVDQQKIAAWKYYNKAPSRRCLLFLQLWEMLRPLSPAEQQDTMGALRMWSNCFKVNPELEKLPMTELQLQELGADSLFTVGLHTLHHAALGLHPSAMQEQEITGNQVHLQGILKQKVDTISFPYGSYNCDSIELVKKKGLNASFTSEKRMITKQAKSYQLGRFAVKDWDGVVFKKKLDEWFLKAE